MKSGDYPLSLNYFSRSSPQFYENIEQGNLVGKTSIIPAMSMFE
jgi:hypothetical protein